MTEALVLVEGQNVSQETLNMSTRAWRTDVLGFALGGVVLRVSAIDRNIDRSWIDSALAQVLEAPGVTTVLTLALKR